MILNDVIVIYLSFNGWSPVEQFKLLMQITHISTHIKL